MLQFASAIKTMGVSKMVMLLRGLHKQNNTVLVRSIFPVTQADADADAEDSANECGEDYIPRVDEDWDQSHIGDSVPRIEMQPMILSIPTCSRFDVPSLMHLNTYQALLPDESQF